MQSGLASSRAAPTEEYRAPRAQRCSPHTFPGAHRLQSVDRPAIRRRDTPAGADGPRRSSTPSSRPCLPQLEAQCLPRPREPRFHGSNGDAERIRNFLVAEAVNFSKDDRRPLIEGQTVQGRLQPFRQLFLRENTVRASFDARTELAVSGNMDVERNLVGAVAPAPESVAIAGLVDCDPVNPGAQGGLT